VEKPESRIRRIVRRALVVAKWTIGGLFILCLLLLGINAFDEDLSPEVRSLLTPLPNPYRPEENLYLALLGFDTKDGDPIKAGQARLAAYEIEAVVALKEPQRVPDAAWLQRVDLRFQGKVGFCTPLLKSCLAGVEAHAREIARLVKDNQELYRRYARLRELKGYHETATPSVFTPIGFGSPLTRQLYLADIALRARSGDRLRRNAAISDLLADLRVWRLELTGNGALISKMVAVANLQGDYGLLADIIADRRIDLDDTAQQIRTALDSSERDWRIGSVLAYELMIHAYLFKQVLARADTPTGDSTDDSAWWERFGIRASLFFFPLNATLNLQAEAMRQMREMWNAEPAKFFSMKEAYSRWVHKNLDPGVRYVYNPMGKILVAFGAEAYEGYPLRAYDGLAFQRMARLGYEIRRQRLEDKAIPEFIRQNPQWASHPVDGRPFLWDEKKREITVQTLGQQPKDRRFSIPIWSATAGHSR